jgi:molecular chaperone HtpG
VKSVSEQKPAAETRSFEAEVSRLLHMMVHSVYSNRDVFLRELVSNAADACEKLRTLSLSEPALAAGDEAFRIEIAADKDAPSLVIADNGIGMDRQELIDNLGTIAQSGTRAFLEQAGEGAKGSALIGQFGVGFYSAFMVADSVTVTSRKAGSDEAWRWHSDGKGAYEIEPVELAEAPARGTRIELHLNAESAAYAETETIERIVTAYSAHVPVPIVLKLADGTEEALADGSALWRKPKSAVTEAEYKEFYGHVGGRFDDPAVTIHYRAEGRTEYSVLLYVPSSRPFDLFEPERRGKVKLYVRRVFITDEAEILPPWLRFVRGVIDSEDLPLNLSREMLQKNPVIEAIGKGVTNRVLTDLDKLATDDPERFAKVWEAFGAVLKEGLYEAPDRRDALFRLARFKTTTGGDAWRSLSDIVAGFRPNQTAIYYALGDDAATIAASPHLEGFAKRGIEVLILADPVDAFWVRTALGFDGKPFESVTQGAAALDLIPALDADAANDEKPASDAALAALAARLKQALGDKVAEVRGSNRLATSPACLVAPEFGPDRQLEKILASRDGAGGRMAAILELNPSHPLIAGLAAQAAEGGAAASEVDAAAPLIFGLARILDGEAPDEPAAFAKALAGLMAKNLG